MHQSDRVDPGSQAFCRRRCYQPQRNPSLGYRRARIHRTNPRYRVAAEKTWYQPYPIEPETTSNVRVRLLHTPSRVRRAQPLSRAPRTAVSSPYPAFRMQTDDNSSTCAGLPTLRLPPEAYQLQITLGSPTASPHTSTR
jgi:hypothetical protein